MTINRLVLDLEVYPKVGQRIKYVDYIEIKSIPCTYRLLKKEGTIERVEIVPNTEWAFILIEGKTWLLKSHNTIGGRNKDKREVFVTISRQRPNYTYRTYAYSEYNKLGKHSMIPGWICKEKCFDRKILLWKGFYKIENQESITYVIEA